MLTFLLRHRDRVVGKPELLTEVWGSRFVSDSALTSRIKSARAAVGDNGRDQHTIRTVHGHGYQFVAPVEERATVGTHAAGAGRAGCRCPRTPSSDVTASSASSAGWSRAAGW